MREIHEITVDALAPEHAVCRAAHRPMVLLSRDSVPPSVRGSVNRGTRIWYSDTQDGRVVIAAFPAGTGEMIHLNEPRSHVSFTNH